MLKKLDRESILFHKIFAKPISFFQIRYNTQKPMKKKKATLNKYYPFILLFTASILTVIAYIRAFNCPIILDDGLFINPEKLKDITKHLSLGFRNIAISTFAINYHISGIDLAWFRATNLALHILTALTSSYLAYITLTLNSMNARFGKKAALISCIVGVFFMLHPIQTGAVSYIIQRMTILVALFSFLGLILYLKGTLNKGVKGIIFYILSALVFLLAVFSKENAIMVILLLPIYDYIFISSFDLKEFRKRFIPYTAIILTIAAMAFYKLNAIEVISQLFSTYANINSPMGRLAWSGMDINWTPLEFLLTEARIVSRYLFLIFFPIPSLLVFDYSNAYPVSTGLFNPSTTIISLFFIITLILISLKYIKKFPLLSFGVLWYIVTVSLESFIMIGLDPYFEHRNYLPSFGIFLALSSLLIYIPTEKSKLLQTALMPFIIIILFSLTFIRTGTWATNEKLWLDTLKKVPDNNRALLALSVININKGEFSEAEAYISNILKKHLTSDMEFSILYNLATIYRHTKKIDEAKAILGKLLEKEVLPENKSGIYFTLGEIYKDEGNIPLAKDYLQRAYKLNNKNPALHLSLGHAYFLSGEIDKSEAILNKHREMEPDNFYANVLLGDIYMVKNEIRKAEKFYSIAFDRNDFPKNKAIKTSLHNYAQIHHFSGKKQKAANLFKMVLSIDSVYYEPYIFLGDIYLSDGDADKAIEYFMHALSLKDSFIKNDPNAIIIYYNLAKAYMLKGDKVKSKNNLEIFLSKAVSDNRLQHIVKRAKEEMRSIM